MKALWRLLVLGPMASLPTPAQAEDAPIRPAKSISVGPTVYLEGTRRTLYDIPFDAIELGAGAGVIFNRYRWLALNGTTQLMLGETEGGLGVGGLSGAFGSDFLFNGFHIEPRLGGGIILVNRVTRPDEAMLGLMWNVALCAGPELRLGERSRLAIDASGQLNFIGGAVSPGYGVRLRYSHF